jgi:anti-sigma regulatory factor (Ser/Thr protein kinase)
MQALRTTNLCAAALADAELIVGELLGNVARHTNGGAVDVALDLQGREPVLHVRDRGPGFSYHARLPNDPMSESGRGLFIAAQLARELSVTRRSGGGSHARAVLAVQPAHI